MPRVLTRCGTRVRTVATCVATLVIAGCGGRGQDLDHAATAPTSTPAPEPPRLTTEKAHQLWFAKGATKARSWNDFRTPRRRVAEALQRNEIPILGQRAGYVRNLLGRPHRTTHAPGGHWWIYTLSAREQDVDTCITVLQLLVARDGRVHSLAYDNNEDCEPTHPSK